MKVSSHSSQSSPSVADLKATFEQHQTVIKTLTAKITTQQANLPSIDDLHATKDLLIKQREQFVDTLTPLDSQWRGAQQEQQRVTKQLTDLRAQLARDEQNQHNAQVQFEQQRGQRQSLMIAQLQQELVDGQPCVVCGSTDHSQMPVTTIVANEADLRQSMQAVDDAQNALAAANKQVEATQQRVEQAETEVDQATQQVTTAQTQLTSTYQQLIETNGLALKSPYDLTAVRAFSLGNSPQLRRSLRQPNEWFKLLRNILLNWKHNKTGPTNGVTVRRTTGLIAQ